MSAPCTISPSRRRAGSSRPYSTRIDSKLQRPATCPSSAPSTSNGLAPSSRAIWSTSFGSTYRNSASGSTNRLINQGHAIRSTAAFFRVTHRIVQFLLRPDCKDTPAECADSIASFERFPVAQLSLGKAPCETFRRLLQLAVFLAAFVAHPAADLVFLRLGQLCDRQDIGIALTLDDVLSDPFELLEELLVVWKDHGARCEGDRSKASQAPPRRHPGS